MSNPRPTSAKNWKKRRGGVDLELPSGNTARVIRPGMDRVLASGVLPDSLTPIALENLEKAESTRPKKKGADDAAEKKMMEELFRDKQALADVFLAFDKVLVMCVKQPAVRLHKYTDEDAAAGVIPEGMAVGDDIPDDEEHRDEETLYSDEVDQMDKMFIFNFALGGSSDLERFRAEHGEQLEALGSE